MLTFNASKNDVRAAREFIRKYYDDITNDEPLSHIVKKDIKKFLSNHPLRKYLLFLIDISSKEGIIKLDEGLLHETTEFKMRYFYRINIGAYYPPRTYNNVILGPFYHSFCENKELGLKCLILGETHHQIIDKIFKTDGYPVWQWVCDIARKNPVDLYTENSYRSFIDRGFRLHGASFSNSVLGYFANLPASEGYIRHHFCDMRTSLTNSIEYEKNEILSRNLAERGR